MLSLVILAAGFSQRFGSPKALAHYQGTTLIDYLLKELSELPEFEILVVLGARADDIKPFIFNHKTVTVVYNKDYKFGQTSSFKAGVQKISDSSKGIFLLPIDCPFVRPQTLGHMRYFFLEKEPDVLVPLYEQHKGHPPIFHSRIKEEILSLKDDVGVNKLLHRPESKTILFPTDDPGVTSTFNTVEEFEQLKRRLAQEESI